MHLTPHIGLRTKLSVLIALLVLALSAVLTYSASRYLTDAINEEFVEHAESIAGFLEASAWNSEGEPLSTHLQKRIDALMEHNGELEKVSVYAAGPDGSVHNIASSDPAAVGELAGADASGPISTGQTRFVEADDDANASSRPKEDSLQGAAELLSPLHDQYGNVLASVGVYIDTGPRDSLIRSQLIRFAIITNLGLLALLVALYFSFNRMMIKPIKSLIAATGRLRQSELRDSPVGVERHDEIGELARAFEKLSESLGSRDEEVGLLLNTSAAVSSTLHFDKILQTLSEKIASSQRVTYCRIALLEPGSHTLTVKAASPARDMDWEYGIGHQLDLGAALHHAWVIESGRPRVLRANGKGELSQDGIDLEREWALTPDTKSALLLPLKSKDEVIGIVTLGEVRSWERTPFSANKIDFYQTLINQTAVAIENASLYEKTEWQVRELSAMHKISQDFTSSLNYQEVISVVAHRVGSLIGAQYASVLLPEESHRYLNIVANYNLSSEYVWSINKKRRIPLGVGPLGKAFTEKAPFVVADVLADSSYENWKHIASIQGYSSLIALPLLAKNASIGVICIYFAETRDLKKDEIDLLTTAANEAAIAIENARMYEDLQEAFVGTIRSLAETIDAKDTYTRGHSERVSLYGEAIARGLGLAGEELETIRYAGYLHDVGKIGIPDAILTKPGKLTLEEFKVIKKHPRLSERILKPVGFPYQVQPIVCHHHERFDGRGYPDGLSGAEIPLGARILFVADAYEAMTSDRPYRKALSTDRALKELKNNRGTQFDPKVVDALVKIILAGESRQPRMRMEA